MDISEIKALLQQQGETIKDRLAHYDEMSGDIVRLKGQYLSLAQQLDGAHVGGVRIAAPTCDSDLMQKMQSDPTVRAWINGETSRISNRVTLPFDMKGAVMATKAALTQIGDSLAARQRLPGIAGLSARARWVWEFLPMMAISGSGVSYVRESGSFRTAGLQSSEGEQKAESSFTTELLSRDFQTVAHWTQVSRQALSDNGELAAFLDGRLREGLWAKLEQQVINGNGTSPQLSGLTDSGNFTAYTGDSSSDGLTKLDHLRDAIRALQVANYRAGLFIVHPSDWFDIETERGNDGQYTWAQPATMLPPTAWGLPVHVTTDMTAGNFICMEPEAATVFFRQEATVEIGTHGDGFIRNLATVLCEGRFALAVHRPEAILYGAFDG